MTDFTQIKKTSKLEKQTPKGSKKSKNRMWMVVLLIAVAVTVTVLVAATRNTEAVVAGSTTVPVKKQDLIVTVTEGGSIRAHNSIQYKCQVQRRRDVSEVSILQIVPAGTYVTQEDVDNGMVLVKLDSSALEDRLVQEKMSLSSDQENTTSAKEAYDIQQIDNESDIANRELNVRFALLDLQKYMGAELAERLTLDINETSSLTERITPLIDEIKNDPNLLAGSSAGQDLKRLNDDIVLAEGNLATAKATLIGTEKLHDANYVSDLDLQRDRLTVQNRQFQTEDSRVALDLFMRYDFPKTTEDLLSSYVESRRQLERTYAQCRSRLAQAQVRLSSAQARLKEQEEQVEELEQQIKYCTIKAKAPGLVVYGTGDSEDAFRAMRGRGGGGMSSGIIAEGEVVTEGQVIISMPDTAAWVAEISVHETEVDKVRPGEPATIVMDAFPDRVLQGEVIEVAPLPDQQRGWMNPDLKVYKTLVRIDGSYDFLKSRMSCKVQILVNSLRDVLVVPIQVVSNRVGKKLCFVATSSGIEEREVKTGVFNDTFAQIVDGLQEGEEVLLNPPQVYSELTTQTADAFEGRELPPDNRYSQDAAGTGTEGSGRSRGSRGMRSSDTTGDTEGGRPQMGRQFELTDEMADRILTNLKQADPEKAAELEQLRKSDPEKFKTELQSSMRNMMRGRNRQGQGGGRNRGEGFGGDDEQQGGGGQGGNRSREGLGGETDQ
jgi:HlyD family secretion protein